jgi:hypothetical protein
MSVKNIAIGVLVVLGLVFLGVAGYGSYQYFFKKPAPQIVNYITNAKSESGGTVNITQPKPEPEKIIKKQHLFLGIAGNQKEVMGIVGWLF